MRSLVVYESMFTNTRAIAAAIGAGLGDRGDVQVAEVSTAPLAVDDGIDLLVVGGPTHAFGLSRHSTRESARQQTTQPLVSDGPGLREWLSQARVAPGTAAAAFDTRVDRPRVPGSAAVAARRRLERLHLRMAAHPETFFVEGMTGPLLAGEVERATAWGRQLAMAVEGAPA